ncbi:MAG: hypothetical protein JAY75_20495, partial [Candidatus Thiodiazotropha taylori]|nr:hypothetical protein [Candidatus Thiodiazotropha taylori]MCW4310599.1 hypothetical protein [Candidatus Thiodiazotropha endolucinida]
MRPISSIVYDASGHEIKSYGAVNVNICLGGFDFEQTLIICDIQQDGVIGQNFLLKYAENISYKHGRINTRVNEINCWVGDDTIATRRVVVRKTTTIPSLTATWLPIEIPGSEKLSKYGYVEASITPNPELAIIPGIIDLQTAEKCISIVNHSEDPITLYARQPVGTCESYEDGEPTATHHEGKTYSTSRSPCSKDHGNSADGSHNRSNEPQYNDPDLAQFENYSTDTSQSCQNTIYSTDNSQSCQNAIYSTDNSQNCQNAIYST